MYQWAGRSESFCGGVARYTRRKERRARDSNPHRLAPGSFQDCCNTIMRALRHTLANVSTCARRVQKCDEILVWQTALLFLCHVDFSNLKNLEIRLLKRNCHNGFTLGRHNLGAGEGVAECGVANGSCRDSSRAEKSFAKCSEW